jgi:hypothetical protein
MSPMSEVIERARKILEEGDPAGALKVLQDAAEQLEAQESYDLIGMWGLLDEQVSCYKALGDQESAKRVRADQARVAMQIDSKRATGEIRSKHPVTDKKKDFPSRGHRPAPKPED